MNLISSSAIMHLVITHWHRGGSRKLDQGGVEENPANHSQLNSEKRVKQFSSITLQKYIGGLRSMKCSSETLVFMVQLNGVRVIKLWFLAFELSNPAITHMYKHFFAPFSCFQSSLCLARTRPIYVMWSVVGIHIIYAWNIKQNKKNRDDS